MSNKVSLIIPTYNERDNIVPLVERIHKNMSGYDYRILFVDDDSRDGTAELAQSLAGKYPVDVLVRKDKKGLASAVVDGLEKVDAEIIGVMDADLQHPPEVLPELVKALSNGADMAIASRYVPEGGCEGWGRVRRVMSKGAIFIAHLLLPSTRRIKDPMSGFFIFEKRAIAGAQLNPGGFKILLEMLMLGNFQKVAEVPYIFKTRSRGESKLKARQQIEYLKHVWSIMLRTGEIWRFVKFCMVGGSGIGVDEGMLYLLSGVAGLRPVELASALSAETAIFTNFTLNDIFTFRDRRSPGAKAVINRFWKFNLICLAGVGIKVGILSLLFNVAGIHYLLANLAGIAVATLWNYFVNTWWTWK